MIKFIKRLFCKHHYELNRWHICHGSNGNDPAMIEAEWICTKCGKSDLQMIRPDLTGRTLVFVENMKGESINVLN